MDKFAVQSVVMEGNFFGATIIEKDGKTMLRVIEMIDAQTVAGV